MRIRLRRIFGVQAQHPSPVLAAWRAAAQERPIGSAEEIELIKFALGNAQHSRSQILQDIWVAYELGEKRAGYFVEFGASDGIELSNTAMLSERYGWHGALAEAHPDFLARLRVNRPRDYICDKAVWSRSDKTLEFALTRTAHLSVLTAVASPGLDRRKRMKSSKITVKAISLNDFLTEARAPRDIDFMSIDVEGAEAQVLGAFDFARWDVNLFCVEHNDREDELDALMARHGYERRFPKLSTIDCWYRRAQPGRA